MNASGKRILVDGPVAGLIGYITVVLFFVVVNAMQGRSVFHTAALLGAHLFHGLRSPAELVIAPGPVLAFNGLHALLFMGAGLFMAWLSGIAERVPQGWYVVGILFLIVMPHVFGLPIWFTEPIQAEIPLWHVVVASSLAALAMGGYLLAVHPRLWQALRESGEEVEGQRTSGPFPAPSQTRSAAPTGPSRV